MWLLNTPRCHNDFVICNRFHLCFRAALVTKHDNSIWYYTKFTPHTELSCIKISAGAIPLGEVRRVPPAPRKDRAGVGERRCAPGKIADPVRRGNAAFRDVPQGTGTSRGEGGTPSQAEREAPGSCVRAPDRTGTRLGDSRPALARIRRRS